VKQRNARLLAHLDERLARFVATACQAEADDPDAFVPARVESSRLDGQDSGDVTRHQQRPARRSWERSGRAGVPQRVQRWIRHRAAIATGVDEPREQLRIIAMTVGLPQKRA
jgi:hypothetical protein